MSRCYTTLLHTRLRIQAENAGILTIATTNHPELIDDAILNRPSRFDVKYTFECPSEELRKIYSLRWMEKAEGGKEKPNSKITIAFEDKDKTATEVAKKTEGWSYAFLKEL
jgi:AAA+ superfamily predicted ATPase